MATVTIHPDNIDTAGWNSPTGAATDIDEAIASADGNTYAAGADSTGQLVLGLGSPGLSDADTITNVTVDIRYLDSGSAANRQCNVDLIIGGSSQGTVGTGNVTASLANYTGLNTAGWNSDWTQTQLDGMQIGLTPTESGKPGTNLPAVDCIDVTITYTAGDTSPTEFAGTLGDLHLGGLVPKALSTYLPYGMAFAPESEEVVSGAIGTLADGANDYLNGLTPAETDGAQLTWGAFFKIDSTGVNQILHRGQNGKFSATVDTLDRLDLLWRNSAFTVLLQEDNNAVTAGQWNWWLLSVDTADAANSHLYINDSEIAIGTLSAGNFDFSGDIHGVFAADDGGGKTSGEMYFLYCHNDYVDISVEATRRKYVNADGTPNLSGMGADGSGLTGTQPFIFLRDSFDSFETNSGSLGNFTVNGAFAEGTTVKQGT